MCFARVVRCSVHLGWLRGGSRGGAWCGFGVVVWHLYLRERCGQVADGMHANNITSTCGRCLPHIAIVLN